MSEKHGKSQTTTLLLHLWTGPSPNSLHTSPCYICSPLPESAGEQEPLQAATSAAVHCSIMLPCWVHSVRSCSVWVCTVLQQWCAIWVYTVMCREWDVECSHVQYGVLTVQWCAIWVCALCTAVLCNKGCAGYSDVHVCSMQPPLYWRTETN